MSFSEDYVTPAHEHSFANRLEIMSSDRCGCFYCCSTFAPTEIGYWINDDGGDTATCPQCTIDSVIGSASGLPATDEEFLKAMHERWFERTADRLHGGAAA